MKLCGPVLGVRSATDPTVGDTLLVGQIDRARGTATRKVHAVTQINEGAAVTIDTFDLTLASGSWPKQAVGEFTDVLGTVDRFGHLHVVADGRTIRIDDAGAQLGFADLNDDGAVEIIRSVYVDVGADDEIVIHELDGGTAPERYRVSVPSIRYLSVGDVDNNGNLDVLVLSEDASVYLIDSHGGQ